MHSNEPVSARAPAAPSVEDPGRAEIGAGFWGSDAIAADIRALGIEYLALNPGASFRGLHDSLVNYLGNRQPQMLLCLHEEIAVAIAHGYAKVSERPMGVVLHSNVGLMHATMAVFNAWCDRVPVLLMGATGPVDATKRRPWIDWIHTTADQAALIRQFIKWDDQPGSVGAVRDALLRANQIARTAPRGPVYVNFDAAIQEQRVAELPEPADVARYAPPPPPLPAAADLDRLAELLDKARRPVFMIGRVSRSEADWQARVDLVERTGARVITDLKTAASFPTVHPAHVTDSGTFLSEDGCEVLRGADLVVSFDWVDLAGAFGAAFGAKGPSCQVAHVSLDAYMHRGWGKEHLGLTPVDMRLLGDPDLAVGELCRRLGAEQTTASTGPPKIDEETLRAAAREPKAPLTVPLLAVALRKALGRRPASLLRAPLSWSGRYWPIGHPLDYLGQDGGGGIGSGPGMAVGAALALRGSGRLPVAILGDGDFLMSPSALWTAVHYGIPVLVLIANNRSFYNDELHQQRMALQRQRPVENKWIGQAIRDPDIDIAAMATAQGAHGIGPIESLAELTAALAEGIEAVEAGGVCVVDVRVQPGYAAAMESAVAGRGGSAGDA